MGDNTVLISIHPEYADMILAGEKKFEFRRRWTARPVKSLFIYATTPIQRIVGFAKVVRVEQGTPTQLWQLTRKTNAGISRRKLFDYLKGSKTAVAIELGKITPIHGLVDPRKCLGRGFRPPQSFRYLSQDEIIKININGKK